MQKRFKYNSETNIYNNINQQYMYSIHNQEEEYPLPDINLESINNSYLNNNTTTQNQTTTEINTPTETSTLKKRKRTESPPRAKKRQKVEENFQDEKTFNLQQHTSFSEIMKLKEKRLIMEAEMQTLKNSEHTIKTNETHNTSQLHQHIQHCRKLFDEGIGLKNQNKSGEAIKKFEQLIKNIPYQTTGYNNKGIINMLNHNYEEANKDFDIANKLKPYTPIILLNNARSQFSLAKKLKSTNHLYKALNFYETLIAIAPNDSRGYNGKGLILKNLGYFKKPLDYFTKAIELNTHPKESHMNRLMLYYNNKQPKKALKDCNTLLEMNLTNEKTIKSIQKLKDRLEETINNKPRLNKTLK